MLVEVLTKVIIVVTVMTVISLPTIVGPRRLRAAIATAPRRLLESWPAIFAVVVVLLANRVARPRLPTLSRSIGIRVTGIFYEIEGDLIVWFQQFASEELNQFFSFVYIYGYVFLLVFPVLAYFALSRMEPFQKLLVAYTLNYTIGPIIYVLVIAFGPRNVMWMEFDTVLYDFQPQYQHLTGEVNRNVNVFPSLHTSLATTIAIFAFWTRDRYPVWFPLATLLAVSVAISTMYLAIHWATDVAAGIVLAVVSVGLAERIVDRWRLVERARQIVSKHVVDRWRLDERTRRAIERARRIVTKHVVDR